MLDPVYFNTVRLLLDVVPDIFSDNLFAIKGGTAINLFVRETPRLSVDIDLVYLDGTEPRDTAFTKISASLLGIAARLEARGLKAKPVRIGNDPESKLLIMESNEGVVLKIEVNTVFRGTILPIKEKQSVSTAVTRQFGIQVYAPILNQDELYASKLVAALDRQHPRDLFDVWLLYENEGLTPQMIDCLTIYLAGHNRPLHEILGGNDKSLVQIYTDQFLGMTEMEPPPLDRLIETRTRLRQDVLTQLTSTHKQFLLGLNDANPDWTLLTHPEAQQLPALRWKLENLKKFKNAQPAKYALQINRLHSLFS